ncbi:phage tail protein [Sphingomonas sp.]|uniref:phage tail protein n=1 Tax=Sphingomonas sp. TaxID=28214 RepID=UPI0025D16D2E|nr:phage tail protein [Sphingomonas sp.]
MATLLLTAVGTVIGGPIGGAIGAILGQAVDQRVFAPKGRQGPRLGDLSVQTSAYGTAIPRVFGTVRAAGTVIWSTDLIEARASQSNGKGKPETTTFSYSASFAVALSARPVLRVGRIWADGNLLRGAGGDFKTATGFRLLPGSADQRVDPLIAGAEGLGTTPAYRGCAVAVFEDFQLADYGNRIPMLSFEIIADEGPVGVATILAELSAGALAGASAAVMEGLAVQGDSVRGVAETLAAALPVSLVDDGLMLVLDGGTTGVLSGDDLGATVAVKAGARLVETRRAAAAIPEVLSIAYYDVGRDYQAGVQRARREGGSRREDRIDLAASLPAGVAKQIVEARLTRLWRERRTVTVTVPWRAMDLRPGDRVTLNALPGIWRIAAVAFERMVVRLELSPQFVASAIAPAADPGRPVAQPDLVHGATILALIDLPPLSNVADQSPQVVVAANGASSGWRNAPLLASVDSGANYAAMGGTAAPATIGFAETLLSPAGTALVDRVNHVDVALANGGLVLNDADDAALLSGANFAMLGREAFQFGQAVPLGGARYRLSELWRGRRGTEIEVGSHVTNEAFVLVAPDTLALVPPALAVAGLVVLAAGIGDGPGVAATIATIGASITPLAPVGLAAMPMPDGSFAITWIRRSREVWTGATRSISRWASKASGIVSRAPPSVGPT